MDIKVIILKSFYGKLSDAEQKDLQQWLEDKENQRLYEKILRYWQSQDVVEFLGGIDTDAALKRVKYRLWRPLRTTLAAAAGMAAVILIGLFLWPRPTSLPLPDETIQCATLTLASGEVLKLDGSALEHSSDEVAIRVNGEKIEIGGGKIVSDTPVYNTLHVPHGESYSVTLPDGTQVWLNAMTSLKFPSTFENASRRMVELEGEAYFEVARDSLHPFQVITACQKIVVTGTSFNITAYAGEVSHTTLCSGNVTVETAEAGEVRLLPGQQLSVYPEGRVKVDEVNTGMYTAWRIGEYYFDNRTLEEVFLTLGRWFEIRDIGFADPSIKKQLFSGKLKKSDGIATILKVIERGSQSRIVYHDGRIDIGIE